MTPVRTPRRAGRVALTLLAAAAAATTGVLRAAYPVFAGRTVAPEVTEVLERWVEAAGGEQPLRKLWRAEFRSLVSAGGGKPSPSTLRVFPRGHFRESTPLAFGEVVMGYDGDAGWQQVTGRGFARLPEEDAAAIARECDLQLPLKVPLLFREIRRLPDQMEEGGRLRVLELHSGHGDVEKWFFGEVTGLRVRRARIKSDGGQTVARYSDFRKIDGRVLPFRASYEGPSLEAVAQLVGCTFNPPLTPEECAPPAKEWAEFLRAEDVLRRHAAAVAGPGGGPGDGRIVRAQVEIPTAGVKYPSVMTFDGAGRVLLDQDVPGVGRNLLGYDGQVGWAWGELQGYRVLEGAELAQLRAAADIRGPLGALEKLPLRRWIGEATIGGRKLQGVELGTLAAREGTFYFDGETGLLARVEAALAAGAAGQLQVVIELEDYRPVAGGLLAFRTTMSNPAVRIITRIESIEPAGAVAAEFFAPRKDG